MFAYHTRWRTVLICLCILGLVPLAEAREAVDEEQYQETLRKGKWGKKQNADSSGKQSGADEQQQQPKQKVHKKPRNIQDHLLRQKQPASKQPEKKARKEWDRKLPAVRQEQPASKQREKKARKERDRPSPTVRKPQPVQPPPERGDRTVREEPRKKWNRPAPTAREKQRRSSHDRHYKRYSKKHRRPHHYRRHETYHYHTRYLAPIRHHYIPRGYRLRYLPHSYIRIVISSSPYFYFGGVFYQHYHDGYIVVGAPIGARISVLPFGFIVFGLGNFTYYYINDTYYLWDDADEAYVVVGKPVGADDAIAEATAERLFVYPNRGQSEERQAKDRYECHQWAVRESGVDPSLWDQQEITYQDNRNYKRAISACLEGRDYTVK